jgi:bifunctional non-homologous end joining protein LigD
LSGRYGLFPIGRPGAENEKDWMIHRMDPPADPARLPMPEAFPPMLAVAGSLPADEARWSFEVKWDGVRALAFVKPGRLKLAARSGNEISGSYPEIRGLLEQTGMQELILDGEIVAFGTDGKPSFALLQRRMHVGSESAVRRLMRDVPVVYSIFDLVWRDGHSLVSKPYEERRAALESLGLEGAAWRVPAAYPGAGRQLLQATAAQGLEGVIAKRLGTPYEPGRRSSCWVKVKNRLRQELVIGGWIPGTGRRESRIGALLMGYYVPDGRDGARDFVFAGRVGTGFTERVLDDLAARLAPLRRSGSPFTRVAGGAGAKPPRNSVYVEPCLVAEVEFVEWTPDGIMRAPSFKGLRDDKAAGDVVREDAPTRSGELGVRGVYADRHTLFEETRELPGGAREVLVDGRRLKISNWDKLLYPATGFTKADLVTFYARIAPTLLPHLRDRPLTLKRYPGGVEQEHFYEKQAPSHRPEWVQTARVGSINYVLANDRPTLVWLGNLADIELHTSLSLAPAPERPTMVVFDLDPGPPAGLVECCEVALVLRGLFAQLKLETVVKTSGGKGMQMYVPLNHSDATYEQTKPFAKRVAELLEARMPELVVSRMTKRIRGGRVLVDWSQNDRHKTTVNVYSLRARERETVSTPVSWEEVSDCRQSGDPQRLIFGPREVLQRVEERGDHFAPALECVQRLPVLP